MLISLVCGCSHSSVKSSDWHPGPTHHHPPAGEGIDTRTLSVENGEASPKADPEVDPCVRAKLLQSCLTLGDPMDCSPPGSSVHEIL